MNTGRQASSQGMKGAGSFDRHSATLIKTLALLGRWASNPWTWISVG